jgi:hypothetical protein
MDGLAQMLAGLPGMSAPSTIAPHVLAQAEAKAQEVAAENALKEIVTRLGLAEAKLARMALIASSIEEQCLARTEDDLGRQIGLVIIKAFQDVLAATEH